MGLGGHSICRGLHIDLVGMLSFYNDVFLFSIIFHMCSCDLIIIIILLTDKKILYIANANLFADQLIRSWVSINSSVLLDLFRFPHFVHKQSGYKYFVSNVFDMMLKMVEIKGELTVFLLRASIGRYIMHICILDLSRLLYK